MQELRNIAIIAHVDHDKTTLVDKMLPAAKLFREDKAAEVNTFLNSNDLERERDITIISKNVSITYEGVKISVIDTPGHAGFDGKVERVLNMADGCLLPVDAFEGLMPQIRFVLQKTLAIGLKPIVVINEVDKPNCRPMEVQDMVFGLVASLEATDEQLDFVILLSSAKQSWVNHDVEKLTEGVTSLLDAVISEIHAPQQLDDPLQMLITSLDCSSYVGRIAVERVHCGTIHNGDTVLLCHKDREPHQERVRELYIFEGIGKAKADSVSSGDICTIVGLDRFKIGDTITDPERAETLDIVLVGKPTILMLSTINSSPFYGREDEFVTSRHIHERLMRELDKSLALRAETTDQTNSWSMSGRGVLYLSMLIEVMRREGYKLQVGRPQVIIKEIDGVKCEPIEKLTINLPDETSSRIIDMVIQRKSEIAATESKNGCMHLIFTIFSRGIIGPNNSVLTASAGGAAMAHRFLELGPWHGGIKRRNNGNIMVGESGTTFAYALNNLQSRGRFFIAPQEEVYAGQMIGEHTKDNDLTVSVCKSKKLTNMRATDSDDKVALAPPAVFNLKDALECVKTDGYVEVTPKSMCLHKILLNGLDRKRASKAQTIQSLRKRTMERIALLILSLVHVFEPTRPAT